MASVRACLSAVWDVMPAVPPFDILALWEELQRAGFSRGQAEALTVALVRIVGEATKVRPGPDTASPDELRRKLLGQQDAQRSWFNRAMTVRMLVNVLVIVVAAALVYVALKPSLTPSPATLAMLFPAIVGAVVGLFGLVVAQFI